LSVFGTSTSPSGKEMGGGTIALFPGSGIGLMSLL
jgi:hypothetical protein